MMQHVIIQTADSRFINIKLIIKSTKRMKVKSCFSELFKYFDLFSTTQFLRYKQGQDFRTVSGGIISLMVVCVFLALFFNTAIQTVKKSIINWSSTNTFSNQPLPTNITFSNSSFMFTIGIMGINLNDPNVRYFDINMISYRNGMGGTPISNETVNLVPCTKAHFGISQQMSDNFDTMMTKYWLCPPLNYTYEISGKFTSKQMKFVEVSITKCNPATDPTRPCINESMIDYMILNYGPFMASYFYINPMINPGQPDYLSYYLQSKNFLSFTKNLGAYSIGFVQDYQIDTDQSLLPFAQYHVEQGVTVPDLFQTVPYQVSNSNYASFYLMKSSLSTTYSRAFNKIDQFFSYVGGLVGTILGLMFFMGSFTSMAYALDLAHKLFKYTEDQYANFKSFSLLSYFAFIPYKIAKICNFCKNWKQMKKRDECLSQVEKQLDISLILRKLNFLQKQLQFIIGQQQYKCHHQQKEQTLNQVKKRRRLYSRRKKQAQNDQKAYNESCSSEESQDEDEADSKDGKKNGITQNSILKIQESRVNKTDQSFILNDDRAYNNNSKLNQSRRKRSQNTLLQNNGKHSKPFKGLNTSEYNLNIKTDLQFYEDSMLQFRQEQTQLVQAPKHIKKEFEFETLDN